MKPKLLASILGLALLALFNGCATMSQEQLSAEAAKVGYGAPLADGWQEKIKEFMETRLKDSSSAIYKFGPPSTGYLTNPPIQGGGLKATGYIVTVMLNAKNSYGAYIGFEEYKFFFRDNQVVGYRDEIGIWY